MKRERRFDLFFRLDWMGFVVVAVFILLIAYPTGMLAVRSFLNEAHSPTLENWQNTLSSSRFRYDLLRTLLISFCAAVLATGGGLTLAALSVRTEFFLRPLLRLAAIGPAITSQTLTAIAWVIVADPGGGLVNALLRRFGVNGAVDVFTPTGLIFVTAALCLPVAFLVGESLFANSDADRETAAYVCGASLPMIWRRVTLPLIIPGITAVTLLCFVQAVVMFSVQGVIGMPAGLQTLTTRIYTETVLGIAGRGNSAVLGVLLVLIGLGTLWIQQLVSLRATSYASIRRTTPLRRLLRGVPAVAANLLAMLAFILLLVIPLGTLAARSFWPFGPWNDGSPSLDAYYRVWSDPGLMRGFAVSLSIAAAAAVCCSVLGLTAARVVLRSQWPLRRTLHATAIMPLGLSGIVLGLSYLTAFSNWPLPFGSALGLLAVALIVREIPPGFKAAEIGIIGVHEDLEAQARICGANRLTMAHRIRFPLVRASICGGAVVVFLAAFREIEASSLLAGPGRETFGYNVFSLLQSGRFQDLGAMAVIGLILCLAVALPLGAYAQSPQRATWGRRL
jgi:iron(III) transport system permease protein